MRPEHQVPGPPAFDEIITTATDYGLALTDVWIFAAAAMILASAGFAASYIPARRTMRVDPIVALRYE